MIPQVPGCHYFLDDYNSKERFVSYWYQINEVSKLQQNSVLEIGIGNGFVSNYLKKRKFTIVTMDIDKELHPDIKGSITDIPLKEDSFEVVVCFEVLEHQPYENFKSSLIGIGKISKKYCIISLPDRSNYWRLAIQIRGYTNIRKIIEMPTIRKKMHVFKGQHYWEIGKINYSLSRIKRDILDAGWMIMRDYRMYEDPHYHFFVLEKI